ncbi:MAG: hypothetical protein J6M39_06770 [Lachnospiraceae bacterium]|nr:hypothetical protein [Lachnospiraceae bacterium]
MIKIKIKGLGAIESQPKLKKENIKLPPNYGILIEKRKHKVITDENKLYGTRQSHKYY